MEAAILERAARIKAERPHVQMMVYESGENDPRAAADREGCCIVGAVRLALLDAGEPFGSSWLTEHGALRDLTGRDPCDFNNSHGREECVGYLLEAAKRAGREAVPVG